MKISQICNQKDIDEYLLLNEGHFSTLGLVASTTQIPMCTFLDSEEYLDMIPNNVTMIITNEHIGKQLSEKSFGICITKNPRIFFFKLHNLIQDNETYRQKHYNTKIGQDCKISPLAYISNNNVTIGNNVIIEEFVSVKENCYIDDNSIIRAGSVIGGEGFEFKKNDKEVVVVKHLGSVLIGKCVEIQYNTTVDKAVYPYDQTIIGDYCKIDNLVHVAHGTKIKEKCIIAAGSCLSGRVLVQENSRIGVGVTISNGLVIGKNAKIQIGSVIIKSVNPDEVTLGNPAKSMEKIAMEKIIMTRAKKFFKNNGDKNI